MSGQEKPVELGLTPVVKLCEQLLISRETAYKRMGRLRIKPWKQSGRSFLDREQVGHMNELHRHYQETGGFDGFPIPEPTGPWEETKPPQEEPRLEESILAVSKEATIEKAHLSKPACITPVEIAKDIQEGTYRQFEDTGVTTAVEEIKELKEQAQPVATQKAVAIESMTLMCESAENYGDFTEKAETHFGALSCSPSAWEGRRAGFFQSEAGVPVDSWSERSDCVMEVQEQTPAEQSRKRRWILAIVLCISTALVTVFYHVVVVAGIIIVWLLIFVAPALVGTKPLEQQEVPASPTAASASTSSEFRLYRQSELIRVVASLKADGSILITGEEGSGKTVLKKAVAQQLTDDGYTVGVIELASTKEMLLNLCEQMGIDTYSLEGKNLTIDGLKNAITKFFQRETAFLIVDDAHGLPNQFRLWLKDLKHQGVPMLLLATDPPRSDIFLNLPRVELKPLSEYAVRELMEQAALKRGVCIDNYQMARLQERAGGNPMLAVRAIDEEYLGLDVEGGDHHRYVDGTPLLLIVGIIFVVFRFVGLGTNNQALYIFGGIAAAVFLGVSRLLYNLPKDSRRIQ